MESPQHGVCWPLPSLGAAAPVKLRIWREKQGWEGAKPFQSLGRNRREQHHAGCHQHPERCRAGGWWQGAVWTPPHGWLRVRVPLEMGESEHPQGLGKVPCQALIPPAFQEPLWQKRCVLAAGGTGPSGCDALVPGLRVSSSLVGLTDPRGQGELAADLGASKSRPTQLQLLSVGVWDSMYWAAPEIPPCAVDETLAFPRASRFVSLL